MMVNKPLDLHDIDAQARARITDLFHC